MRAKRTTTWSVQMWVTYSNKLDGCIAEHQYQFTGPDICPNKVAGPLHLCTYNENNEQSWKVVNYCTKYLIGWNKVQSIRCVIFEACKKTKMDKRKYKGGTGTKRAIEFNSWLLKSPT